MKRLLIIIDGMEDEPIPELGNMSPVEYATMNALSFMRKHGKVSHEHTIPDGMEASTEVALLTILGVPDAEKINCRSWLEALGAGIEIGNKDLCLRYNLISHRNNNIVSHCGFNPDFEESYAIADILNRYYGNEGFEFISFGNFRGILIVRDCLSSVIARPPHTLLNKSVDLLNVISENKVLESQLNHCINDSRKILQGYKANGISMWAPSNAAKFYNTIRGSVVAGANIVKGIGKALGMNVINVQGATGDENTDLTAKLRAAQDALKNEDFVLLHIEATDEVSHQQDWRKKVKLLEKIDNLILMPLLNMPRELDIIIQSDHATSSITGQHLKIPVTVINYKKNRNMKPKITIIGIGPGNTGDMTFNAIEALRNADAIVGYKYYIPFIKDIIKPDAEIVQNGMKQENARIEKAFEIAESGHDVCVISSGDSGIYGMAPLVYEMLCGRKSDIEIEVIPGISAFQKAAALLGAPIGHDFCVISLSDLMTPWSVIERRIKAAVDADFITAVYNPKSTGRYWQLYRLKELYLAGRHGDTPVGYVRQAGREQQKITVTTIKDFNPEDVDMFTVVIIGNSQSYQFNGQITTPRGYYRDLEKKDITPGQTIMMESFRTIEGEMANQDIPLDTKWPIIHAIHTTADFDMENIVKVDDGALEKIYKALTEGDTRTIITDVTMAAAGIRKGAMERLGIQVRCYLNDAETSQLAKEKGITRTQAGIRRAVAEYPNALYVFGNAPTALMELCTLIRQGKAYPCGVVAAPVGFVHVCESKHMVKPFVEIPKIIVEGRKGGSNLAATLVNSILCWPDAQLLKPGRDV